VCKIVACWLSADFLSGLWHWIEDRYFEEQWPIIGKHIAKPNTLHHAQPTAFLDQGYFSRNWTTFLPAAAVALVVAVIWGWCWTLLILAFVSQANEVHAFAHRRVQWRWIRGLQEFGLFQSPRHHAVHHKDPFNVKYCVMSDWVNPILDAVRFWQACEYLLACVGLSIRQECMRMDALAVLRARGED
jgi:ubiquitin-conjugating enzyme E2 variant